jgi:flagellar basal-body rod protein FlgC
MDALQQAIRVATTGLNAQSQRMRVVSENLANAHSTGEVPGADPYRRKTIGFDKDDSTDDGVARVGSARVDFDRSPFRVEYLPGHPAADDRGYVRMPNVNTLIELADMREAQRSYMANVQMIKQSRELISMTLDLLRPSS